MLCDSVLAHLVLLALLALLCALGALVALHALAAACCSGCSARSALLSSHCLLSLLKPHLEKRKTIAMRQESSTNWNYPRDGN